MPDASTPRAGRRIGGSDSGGRGTAPVECPHRRSAHGPARPPRRPHLRRRRRRGDPRRRDRRARRRGHGRPPDGARPRARPQRRARTSPSSRRPAGIEVDLLIAAGCVEQGRRLPTSASRASPASARSSGARSRPATVEVIDLDEAHCVMGLRAAAHGLPFLPWRGGVGTDLPASTRRSSTFDDPVRGEPLLGDARARARRRADLRRDRRRLRQRAGRRHRRTWTSCSATPPERVIVQVDRDRRRPRRSGAQPERTWYWARHAASCARRSGPTRTRTPG